LNDQLEGPKFPLIAQRRLLKPRSEAARQQLDDTFDAVRGSLSSATSGMSY